MENNSIIREIYSKSSGGSFKAKGRCKALFRGREYFEDDFLNTLRASLSKKNIRVFDIHLYDKIEINETVLFDDWDWELSKFSNSPQFEVILEKEAAVYFSKLEWENVDFIRTDIEKGILINPSIIYAYQEDGFTFGEIEGDLLFKVHNPKPEIKTEIKPEILETVPAVTTKTIFKNTFEPLLPIGVTSSNLPSIQSAGCFWSILRFLILLLLTILLFKGCSQFSSDAWNRERENIIKSDSTLRIPDGDEKEFKDGKNKFQIDIDSTTIVVPPGLYKLFIRDHGTKVDHDKINLFVNGQLLKRNMEIYSNPTEIPLTNLRYGQNLIDFAVISQGDQGNCTAEIIFVNTVDGQFTTKLKINNVVNHISRLKLIQR